MMPMPKGAKKGPDGKMIKPGGIFSGASSKPKAKPPASSDDETPQPSLQDLKDKHVEEKAISDAERETKYAKRKRLIAVEQEKQSEQLSQGLTMLGGMLLDLLCVRLPNPLPPTEMEKQLFGQALSEVSGKYVPSMINYAPEMMLVTMLVVVIVPRIKPDGKTVDADFTEVKDKPKEQTDGFAGSGTESRDGNGQDGERKNPIGQDDQATIPAIDNA
jgi:hypothetical protein